MHKQDLIEKIARKTKVADSLVQIVLNALLSEITLSLKNGKTVTVTGFGTFLVRRRKKSIGRNLHTSEKLTIPAHKLAGFVPGATLRRAVRRSR